MIKTITQYIALITPLSILVSVCYLYGYWNEFGVSVFSQVSVQEIIVSAAIPFLSALTATAAGLLLGGVIARVQAERPGESATKRSLKKWAFRVFDFLTISILIFMLLYGGYLRWHILPAILTLLFIFLLHKNDLLRYFGINRPIASICVFLAVLLPLQSYGAGKVRAGAVISGTEYRFIKATVQDMRLVASETSELRHIGTLNGLEYFYDVEQSSIKFFAQDKLDGHSWYTSFRSNPTQNANKKLNSDAADGAR